MPAIWNLTSALPTGRLGLVGARVTCADCGSSEDRDCRLHRYLKQDARILAYWSEANPRCRRKMAPTSESAEYDRKREIKGCRSQVMP
jgi:hypothetical protein